MGNNMKRIESYNDKGFSLVELLVVVALIAVLGLVASAGISLVTSRPADECAKKIQIALEGNRNTTMGKFSAEITFSIDGNGVYVEEFFNGDSEGTVKIGQGGVSVKYYTQKVGEESATENVLSSSSSVTISFDRADGSLNPQPDGSYVKYFIVSKGDRSFRVEVDRLTGRVGIE